MKIWNIFSSNLHLVKNVKYPGDAKNSLQYNKQKDQLMVVILYIESL
jgi:hypothetical protein